MLEYQLAERGGDWDEAYDLAGELVERSPDSEWLYLLGLTAYRTRRYRAAIEALERVDPDRGWIREWGSYWHVRLEARHCLGDHVRELEDVDRFRRRVPDDEDLPRLELLALAAAGTPEELMSRVEEIVAAGTWRDAALLGWTAQERRAHGDAATARRVAAAGLGFIASRAPPEPDARWWAAQARLLDAAHRRQEARAAWASLALEDPERIEYRGRLGVLAARRGDRAEAERIDRWLQGIAQPKFDLNGGPLVWRARIAAQTGERERAAELVRSAIEGGLQHSYLLLHAVEDLAPLRGYPPFEALLRPRG